MAGMISIPIAGNLMETDQIARDLEGLLLTTALEMVDTYEEQVVDWEDKPVFTVEYEAVNIGLIAIVSTQHQVFEWVNDGTGQAAGTRPDWYPIFPVRAPALAYPRLFDPKTAPFSLNNQPGGQGKYGETVFSAGSETYHPGIEPRHFDEDITELFTDIFEERIRNYFMTADFFNLYRR